MCNPSVKTESQSSDHRLLFSSLEQDYFHSNCPKHHPSLVFLEYHGSVSLTYGKQKRREERDVKEQYTFYSFNPSLNILLSYLEVLSYCTNLYALTEI